MVAINIRVEDVNGDAVKDCHIEVSDNLGNKTESAASATGELTWSTNGSRVRVSADHPLFATEAITASIAPIEWDLPTARLKSTGGSLEIVVVLGRLVAAPIYEVKSERLKVEPVDPKAIAMERAAIEKRKAENLKRLNNEVSGVLAETRIGARDRYLWLRDEHLDHERADEFVTVDVDKNRRRVLTSAKAKGWARFVTKRSRIDTAAQGQFWLLEYGGSPGRRRRADAPGEQKILVAVYIPDLEAGPTPAERDMLVFLTPNTAKPEYAVQYPYGLNMSGKYFLQPFIAHLGVGYLFGRFHMPHQILAMQKKTILVLPVWRSEGPGALLTTSGMLRLLREVQHFAHNRGFSGIRRAAIAEFPRGGRTQSMPPSRLAIQQPVPRLARFGIAAFSQGGDYLATLLGGNDSQDLPPTLSVPVAARRQFAEAWLEAFDIDCVKSAKFDTALVKWKRRNERRGVRILWTGHTGRSKNDLERKGDAEQPLLGALVDGPIEEVSDASSTVSAHEFQSERGGFSALVTTLEYLKPQVDGDIPIFSWSSDPHQFAPNLGLAWALGCSVLR
jgi:hypothetical protein